MVNFYTALEEGGFQTHEEILIARDIPGEYRKLMTYPLSSDKAVLVFNTREDITDLCRQEEKRMEKLTGEPRVIDDTEVAAVFIWNKTFGIVSDEPRHTERWTRYFQMDTNAPCVACTETDKKRTVCGNCGCIVCLECTEKLDDERCPGCTLEMSSFKEH